jgi:glutathione synthase/RimK-type ligase-like ATP-grasp enzyme
MSVLIVTMPGDIHAHAVRWAIEKLGGKAEILYPADLCDGALCTLNPTIRELAVGYKAGSEKIDLDENRTVWMRRPPSSLPQEKVLDEIESAVVESDFGILADSVYLLLESGSFAVNPVNATKNAGCKPYQLSIAQKLGLNSPRTLISNSPDEIFDFYEDCAGDIVFKPFTSPVWQTSNGPKTVPTTSLSRGMLESADLTVAPAIYQKRVNKHAEVRATVMGRTIFAWEKRFDKREDLDVDWRYMFKNAKHSIHRLPAEIEAACFSLLDQLGLVFGCFDFAIDQDGRYFFLEVNPQGQWLWGDRVNEGCNQLEAMAEFLLSREPLFKYSQNNKIEYSDFQKNDLNDIFKMEGEQHYGHLMTFMHYQRSFPMKTEKAKG